MFVSAVFVHSCALVSHMLKTFQRMITRNPDEIEIISLRAASDKHPHHAENERLCGDNELLGQQHAGSAPFDDEMDV